MCAASPELEKFAWAIGPWTCDVESLASSGAAMPEPRAANSSASGTIHVNVRVDGTGQPPASAPAGGGFPAGLAEYLLLARSASKWHTAHAESASVRSRNAELSGRNVSSRTR